MTDFDIQVILDCRCVRRMSSKLQAGVDYLRGSVGVGQGIEENQLSGEAVTNCDESDRSLG